MDCIVKIKAEFGEHLQELRLAKNISIRSLAARSGLEYSHVQQIASGKVNASLTTIVALAEGLEFRTSKLSPTNLPDVILMDIQMPVMDGYPATTWVRKHYPQIHISLCTDSTEAGHLVSW